MDLLTLLFVIAVVGFGVHLVVTHIPMPSPFRTVIILIAVIALFLYVLRVFNINLPNLVR